MILHTPGGVNEVVNSSMDVIIVLVMSTAGNSCILYCFSRKRAQEGWILENSKEMFKYKIM